MTKDSIPSDLQASEMRWLRRRQTVTDELKKWKNDAAAKRTEIGLGLVGFIVSVGLVGLWLPSSLNQNAIDREDRQRCWEASTEARRAVMNTETGFIVQPSAPVPRSADLRATTLALQNVRFACADTLNNAALESDLGSLIDESSDITAKIEEGFFRTGNDFEESRYVERVNRWIDSTLETLSV